MRLPRPRRPSPAMIVALLALFVALGGTAVAARSLIGPRDIARGAVRSIHVRDGTLVGADVRDRSLTPRDFRGSVQGPQGPPGTPGTARAFAHVFADGTLETAAARSIGRVTRPAAGTYCFYLPFRPANVVATLDAARSPAIETVKATTRPDDARGNACTGAESASVSVIDSIGNRRALKDGGFFVLFN